MAADHAVRPEAEEFTDTGQSATFRITRRAELVTALKQRTLPIIIENEELVRPFERYQRTQYWWPAGAITASLIMRSFPEIEFKRTEWDVHRTVERKIVLKPRGRSKRRKGRPCAYQAD